MLRAAFRVQQAGWRDLKEYMETYGQPERWENGSIRCTRVKSNGYYTYWSVVRANGRCIRTGIQPHKTSLTIGSVCVASIQASASRV